MGSEITIWSDTNSNAFSYVIDFIFREFYEVPFKLFEGEKPTDVNIDLAYSKEPCSATVWIESSKYLESDDLLKFPELIKGDWEGLPCFFFTNGGIGFDLLSAIFISLSRVEEVNARLDIHGRFPARDSIAFKLNMLDRPYIDQWLFKLADKIGKGIPQKLASKSGIKWCNTYDIDIAYAHLGRSLFRAAGGAVKSLTKLNFNQLSERVKVLSGFMEDPFDTYAYQKEISSTCADSTFIFFLVGGNSKYDIGLSPNSQRMKNLILDSAKYATVGLHPSYSGGVYADAILREKETIEEIINSKVDCSRQHFLKFKLPDTYRELSKAGITRDFSMGYADIPGFRAGTCRTFNFYDCKMNEALPIRITPLHLMDGTLRDYMKLSTEEASEIIRKLIQSVKQVNGELVTLWHNDLLAVGNPWRDVYEEMARKIQMVK